jgi:hypothetical protein
MTSFKTIPNHSHKVGSSGKKLNSHLLTNFNLDTILDQALQNTSEYLRQFRFNAGYTTKLETAFGSNFNRSVANQIFDKLAKGNFSDIPSIEIVNRKDINGANGAFAIATGKIYLSQEFITANAQNVNAIVAVLLEEYGHYVDSRINTKDAAGDEGDIFARLVQGKSISQQELAVLRAEDDSATVTLDGQVIQIEQNISGNVYTVTTNSDLDWGDNKSGSLRDAIQWAEKNSGRDTIKFNIAAPIYIGSSLPTLVKGNDIDFIGSGNFIDAGLASQIITVDGANVSFSKLTFKGGYAKGGDGNNGGGGGLGAGGALFINSGNVTVNNVTFSYNKALGGNAYGNAGSGGTDTSSYSTYIPGANSSSGGSSGGLNGGKGVSGGSGGDAGKNGNDGNYGGDFGVGGGGGGGGGGSYSSMYAAFNYNGGNGGVGGWTYYGGGGGGGGGAGGNYGAGGAGGLGFNGGGNGANANGQVGGQGGGGAGLGGAIFVNSGATLTLQGSSFENNLVLGGDGANKGQGIAGNIFVREQNTKNVLVNYEGSNLNDNLAIDADDNFYLKNS